MNLQAMFRDFNPGKFLVWLCVCVFTALLSLRLDKLLDWTYWAVFAPLWLWKAFVVAGALVANIVWIKNPHYRLEGQSAIQYRALLISLGIHLFILLFELLLADNLETGRHSWLSVFSPLIVISLVSIAACIWGVKHNRSIELELYCSVNLLQFIFVALKLDGYIAWPWEVVLVPAWVVVCASIVAVLYSIVFAGLLLRLPEVNADRRRTSLNSAIAYTCLVAPLLCFLITLASKLNGESRNSYTSIVMPLYITYCTRLAMAFSSKRANQWWFGLRKDMCQFLLGVCPLLQEYANISYALPVPQDDEQQQALEEPNPAAETPNASALTRADTDSRGSKKKKKQLGHGRAKDKEVVPHISLEVPD
ncbi:transmembrane protein 185A [Hyalella azteca]|uniref:Transmembrane protein 185A n=1 Tax=Hyalella azteca TaxID=294128 RepID=A0A8B7MYF4_HYAAZ|nr:transmembrane protein 185A [Hyalella azteca]